VLAVGVAGAFPVYDVSAGAPLEFNAGGTSFNSLGSLSNNQAIQCFANYASGGVGTCLLLGLEGPDGDQTVSLEGSQRVFNANETLEISVTAFSASRAVVCYHDAVNENHLTCTTLTIADDNITGASPAVTINVNATSVAYAVTRFSDEVGAICWSYKGYMQKDGAGVCNKLTLDADGVITVGGEFFFDDEHNSQDFSISAFSATKAVLCWNAEQDGTCTTLMLDNGNLAKTNDAVFGRATESNYEGLVVVSLSEEEGVVCWSDGVDVNQLECKLLMVSENISVGAEAVVVNANPTSHISATKVTDPDTQEATALVCYASEPGHTSTSVEFRGNGTCNIVGRIGNETLGSGPANEVNARPTEYTALVTLESNSILCYSGFGAGQGQCRALSMAETTTSTTATSSTSLTSTMTTTPHTTTGTTITGNTVTETSTTSPHTTTYTETTTTPHTTTETSVTTVKTTEADDSSSPASALLSVGAALAAFLSLAA
jgi:hypothetical protein